MTEFNSIVEKYGDLIFDLALTVLWRQKEAEVVTVQIFRTLRRNFKNQNHNYQEFERAYVLKIACEHLEAHARKALKPMSSAEKVMTDQENQIENRLRAFDVFFHRLSVPEQILLILRDKYGLPYTEIAASMSTPEDTLCTMRSQALKTLEDRIWNEKVTA